jgi:hypothetical protein
MALPGEILAFIRSLPNYPLHPHMFLYRSAVA